jgi:hypothetical protein
MHDFLIYMTAGAAALALWVDARYPKLGPGDVRRTMLHVAGSIIVAQALFPLIADVAAKLLSPTLRMAVVLGVALPVLTYCLLACVWAIKFAQRALGGSLR